MSIGRQPAGSTPVIVAGCRHAGLSVIRSLGRRGVPVYGLTHETGVMGLSSRFLSGVLVGPDPGDPEALSRYLMGLPDEFTGALIIDTLDNYAVALADEADGLSTRFRLVGRDRAKVDAFADKDLTRALAERCGVPYPRSIRPARHEDVAPALRDGLRLPSLIKPIHSHEFAAVFSTKAFLARTEAEAREGVARALDAGLPVLVQEIIPGREIDTMEKVQIYRSSSGRILGEFFNMKIRQTPPRRGVMSAGKSTGFLVEADAYTRRLVTEIDYRGYASAEYKRDPRDGVLKLIEVNMRLPRNNALSLRAGVDFAWLMYRDHVEGVEESLQGYRGAYYVDVVSDLADLLVRHGSSGSTLGEVVGPYLARRKVLFPWAWDDPVPLVAYATGKATTKLLARVRGARRPSAGPREHALGDR